MLLCYQLLMTNTSVINLTLQQLRRAVAIKENIAALETELGQILGASASVRSTLNRPRRRKMSSAARAKIAAAQKARWAKSNRANTFTAIKRRSRRISAKARAKLSANAKIRWAKAKAAGKKSL
jgi:hypothetical protein